MAALFAFLVVGHAGAEPVDPAARTRPVPVWFVDNSGVKPFVDIYADGAEVGKARALASCRLPCGFRMAQGRYVLHVGETDDTFGGHRPFVVDGPSRVGLEPRHTSQRTVGLVLGIAGPLIAVAGIGLISYGGSRSWSTCGEDGSCSTKLSEAVGGGILALLAGLTLTPIGWTMFGSTFHPAIDTKRMQLGSTPSGRIDVVGVASGVGVAGKIVF